MVEIQSVKTRLDNEGYKRLLMLIAEAEQKRNECLSSRGQGVNNGGAGTRVSDNSDVEFADIEIEKALSELNRLRAILRSIDVVETTYDTGVNIGDIVTLLEDGIEDTYRFVSYNPQFGEISSQCPLGIAIKGANIGDTCKYQVDKITYFVTITNIEKAIELSQIESQRAR